MLILLLGPSGSGKSTVARILVTEFGWRPLISIVTRPERDDEIFKMSVSPRSYAMLARHGKLWSDVSQGCHQYGLLRNEVEVAIADPSAFHVVDFGLSSRNTHFTGQKHLAVYVSAGDENTLRQRLVASGRPDRIEGAVQQTRELDEWYEENAVDEAVEKVINGEGRVMEVATEIDRITRNWIATRNNLD